MAKTINELEQPKSTNLKRSLSQREDFVGETYRTIRDYPKTSAAIATGVVAAAAGTTAFLLNRKSKIGTATGHATADADVVSEVNELNDETLSKLNKNEIKAGSVAY